MAHECTNCGREFPDGSTEMLSGCPTCDGNRFQYLPDGDGSAPPARDSGGGGNLIEAEPDPEYAARQRRERDRSPEDRAQADARSSMVTPDQLPRDDRPDRVPPAPTEVSPEEPATERPGLEKLREQLDDRFESIKIVDRGEYELNLMELYERKECIIELQEDGRYVIEVPETLTDS